ncbi:hypothetical protein bcgnr5390_10110 [Bacillus luti]|nr:hypothetical protein BC2903_30800 [Bacillus cereus]
MYKRIILRTKEDTHDDKTTNDWNRRTNINYLHIVSLKGIAFSPLRLMKDRLQEGRCQNDI